MEVKTETVLLWQCTGMRKNNLRMITHKFLDGGHTQNEDDSVHRTIESAVKNVTVYTPEQWYSTVRIAR